MIINYGTILKTYLLGESGLIVVWSTEEYGIIRTAARYALRPNSEFSGRIDLFHACEAEWNPTSKGDLHTLTGITLQKPRLGLRKNLASLQLASYMVQLLLHTVETQTPIPDFYVLMENALDYLNDHEASEKLLLHYEKRLAQEHGLLSSGKSPIETLKNHFGRIPDERENLIAILQRAKPVR